MLGAGFALPFITMAAGASFALLIGGQSGMVWRGVIGFGVGCAS